MKHLDARQLNLLDLGPEPGGDDAPPTRELLVGYVSVVIDIPARALSEPLSLIHI